MINAQSVITMKRVAPAVRRPGARTFWLLFGLEAILVAVALALVLGILPQRTPLARTADADVLRGAVWTRLDGAFEDPVVEVKPGVTVRSSAVRGFELGGLTYHYYFEGRPGFDPLSRGTVSQRDVEVLVRESDGERTLVIYRILGNTKG